MTFAEHAVAQVLREVADEMREGTRLTGRDNPVTTSGLIFLLDRIATKLSPQPKEK